MNLKDINIVNMIFMSYLHLAVKNVVCYFTYNIITWQILKLKKIIYIFLFIGEFVIGRVIKAMNANWHPGCFRCEECNGELADAGFIKCQGRALCHTCNARVKAGVLGKYICHQCQYEF